MLLAALSCLHEKLHAAGDSQRCQVVETAISQFANSFKALLLSSTQMNQASASGQPVDWQQVGSHSLQLTKVAHRPGVPDDSHTSDIQLMQHATAS